jgi:21S rRNA (uridine2791-2'-O)-methyltransferase
MAALTFSFDTLKTGGHFLCKFYQGTEEKAFETKLKRLFAKVQREKPDSSRTVCLSQVSAIGYKLTSIRSLKRRTL